MSKEILLYLGSLIIMIWAIAHLFPTKSVVAGFGETTADNKLIVMMEWITEGVALIFIAILVATVTFLNSASSISRAVYITSSLELFVLAMVSVFTGFRIRFLPFKLCPFIFSSAAILFLVGTFI